MQQVGTTGAHPVMSGLFHSYATSGLPLAMVFTVCKEQGWVPSWTHFYIEATENGWSHDTIISRLSEAVSEVWGPHFRDVIIECLERIYADYCRTTEHSS